MLSNKKERDYRLFSLPHFALLGMLVFLSIVLVTSISHPVAGVAPNPATDEIVRDLHFNALNAALCTGGARPEANRVCHDTLEPAVISCINDGIARTTAEMYPEIDNEAAADCIADRANMDGIFGLGSRRQEILNTLVRTEAAVVEQAGSPGQEQQDVQNSATSGCVAESIGWVVCPLSRGLANFTGFMFTAMQYFLEVPTISTVPGTDTKPNALYSAWSIMRNIANVLLVIVFLLIIYSQMVGGGKR